MKKIIDEKLDQKLREYSEGNEYLYSLLRTSWENNLKTNACCGGHKERKENYVYISYILTEENLPLIENIIGALEKIPNIEIHVGYRKGEDIPKEERRTLVIHMYMHNRMEVFHKIEKTVLEKEPITTKKGLQFYRQLLNFMKESDEKITEYEEEGIVYTPMMTMKSTEYQEYQNKRRKFLYPLIKRFQKKEIDEMFDTAQTDYEEEVIHHL